MPDPRDDGGPAFPNPMVKDNPDAFDDETTYTERPGLMIRDYFAVAALSGFMAAGKNSGWGLPKSVAKQAYEFADAMLEARKR